MATKKAAKSKSTAAKKPKAKKTAVKAIKAKGKSRTVALRSSREHTVAGNNSGINQPLIDILEQIELHQEQQRDIGKHIRELKAHAKDQHGHDIAVINDQLKKRKMDAAKRATFEMGCQKMNDETGYQFSMDLLGNDDDADAQEAAEAADEADAA